MTFREPVQPRRTREALADRAVPLAGLTGAFMFAGQMVNFPTLLDLVLGPG